MKLHADIHKKIGNFELNVLIESDAKRIGILGASGSGKSMTLRSIAGIESVDSGYIEVGGRVLFDSGNVEVDGRARHGSTRRINLRPQQRNVGYMFQNYALFPTMSVLKNVTAGLKGSRDENRTLAREMLKRFGIDNLEDRLPGELSGGQQQRVALARIMVTEPELILLDEPFSALDGYLRDRMQMEMMEMLEDYPGQVVMVSHSRDELYRFSEELFVVRGGQILTSGETKKVFREPGRIEVAKLTGCKNFSDVRVTDSHTIETISWGLTMHLEKEIPEDIRHIGYRAHYFEPVWGEKQENCIPFDLIKVDDLPFEKNYYIRPVAPGAQDDMICWFVQSEEQKILEERGMPDYLKLKEEHVLILK